MQPITFTEQEISVLWQTIEQCHYPGSLVELVAGIRAKLQQATLPAPPVQDGPMGLPGGELKSP